MAGSIKHVAFRTFYIVSSYILLFTLWWGYLLYQKNETAYTERIEIMQMRFEPSAAYPNYTLLPEYQKLTDKYERQKLMIFLEGGVYLLLLLVGFRQVKKLFLKEMELAEQQKNFLLSVTHELKSPLSTVKLSLQTFQKHQLEKEQQQKLITNSLSDLERLQDLVDNILLAAKIEREKHGMQHADIDISALSTTIAERFITNKKRIVIHQQVEPGIHLYTDALGFTSMLVNLIENAIKYSEPETATTVSLSRQNGVVTLAVADEGIGIPEKERSKVFEKFYRVGSENTRTTKGTGLGLYIVKRFVEINKGRISIQPNTPQGTRIVVEFDAAD